MKLSLLPNEPQLHDLPFVASLLRLKVTSYLSLLSMNQPHLLLPSLLIPLVKEACLNDPLIMETLLLGVVDVDHYTVSYVAMMVIMLVHVQT